MVPTNFPRHLFQTLSLSVAYENDPGDDGTIRLNGRAFVFCPVVTEAAETRSLEDASNLPVGCKATVMFKTDGGDLTIDTDDQDVVLDTAGQCATFVVVESGTDKVWRVESVSRNLAPVEVTGDRNDTEAALANLLTALESLGLITDSTASGV